MNHINIFTQTTIKSPRAQKGKIIYLLESVYKGEPITKHFIDEVEGNWNDAGMEAVRRALKKVNGPAEIVIWTDCPYVELNIDRAREWQQEDFETTAGEKRKHWEQWKDILECLEGCTYKVTTGRNEYTHWLISELKRTN